MKKKIIILLTVLLTAATALAQDPPRIAVYVTGGVPENEKKALGTMMLAALVNSGRYRGIERSDEFVAEIDREHVRQRSGAIDDEQISTLGKQFGVEFICIADITPALGDFQVSARIINVETAEVVFIGASSSPLKTMKDLSSVADRVVRAMFGIPEPERRNRMSAGAGGFFVGDFGGGIIWNDAAQQVAMPYSGGGAFLFFDAVYAEVSAGFAIGGGKWESDNTDNPDLLLEMSRISLTFGLFGKYPIEAGPVVTIFPLVGIDYELAMTAKFTRPDGSEIPMDGRNGRAGSAGDLSALWVKFGGGVDFALNDNMYLRASLLYGIRTANKFETDNVGLDKDVNAQARMGHGVSVRVGAGVRF